MELLKILSIIISFPFLFFIPGFVIVETFVSDSKIIYKIPIYMIFSVMLSTYLVYFTSLLLGYSSLTIVLTYLFWLIWFLILLLYKDNLIKQFKNIDWKMFIFPLFVFLAFTTALYPAIFFHFKNYFVMSADNWQDTAMHLSIIESINQGNFPPQAPYFSGYPLSYYYLADFHSAIFAKLSGQFFPRILVIDNSVFASIFSLSVYTFAYYISKNKLASVMSSFLATFGGSFVFLNLLEDWKLGKGTIKYLVSTASYSMDFGKLYQLTPVVDYFLQNRPMMVGLPAFAVGLFLIIDGFKKFKFKNIILAAFFVGLAFKFQLFVFGSLIVSFGIVSLIFIRKNRFKRWLCLNLSFLGVCLSLVLIMSYFFKSNNSIFSLFVESFRFGPWAEGKNVLWYLKFVILNIGYLLIFIAYFLFLVFFRYIKISKLNISLFVIALILFIIPFCVKFTVFYYDMLKFFYILTVPVCVIASMVLDKLLKIKFAKYIVILLLLIFSITGFVTLGSSFLNRNYAYSENDLRAGLWIRKNTPEGSIFITSPSIHNPPSDIAGRPRILSYINWPHSHGFYVGSDNVFSRVADIDRLYQNPTDSGLVSEILLKYNAEYIYVGPEENGQFHMLGDKFSKNNILEKIYDEENIKIYKSF